MALAENGTLERYGVELIGADLPAIQKAEDRQLFKQAMERIGVKVCPSGIASSMEEAEAVGAAIGTFPRIIRPAFTLGGSGVVSLTTLRNTRRSAKAGLRPAPSPRF